MKTKVYNLQNKQLLAKWLGLSLKQLNRVVKRAESNYRVFPIGRTKRQVERPVGLLEDVHRKIKTLLDVIVMPEYVHSGRKKHSYVTNARAHLGAEHIETMDVKSFYKTCSREFIFRFFHYELGVASDVSWVLVDLLTFKGYLPTGSPVSQLLAYLSNKKIFDEINELVVSNGGKFTLFVDDLTISSSIPLEKGELVVKIKKIIKKHGLKLKRSKVKKYTNLPAEVTGAVLAPGEGLLAPNRLYKKLFNSLDVAQRDPLKMDEKNFRSSMGVLRSIRSLQKNILPNLYFAMRNHEMNLNRSRKPV